MNGTFDPQRLARALLLAKAAQKWIDSKRSVTNEARPLQRAKPSPQCPLLPRLQPREASGLEKP